MSGHLLRTQNEYAVALLHLLADSSRRAMPIDIMEEEFQARYNSQILDEHRGPHERYGQIWRFYLAWAPAHLKKRGYAINVKRGVWAITDAGREWLREHPDAISLCDSPRGPQGASDGGRRKPGKSPKRRGTRGNRVVSPPEDASAHEALGQEISRIRAFLQGRSTPPSDEKLCDWVQFCYTLGLYAEGAELFRLVDKSAVNDWYYKRTQRMASRM